MSRRKNYEKILSIRRYNKRYRKSFYNIQRRQIENSQIKYNINRKFNISILYRRLNAGRALTKQKYYIYIETLIDSLKPTNQYFYSVREKLSSLDNLFFVAIEL